MGHIVRSLMLMVFLSVSVQAAEAGALVPFQNEIFYPAAARAARLEGKVVVEGKGGRVQKISGHSALRAAATWHARRITDKKRYSVTYDFRIVFPEIKLRPISPRVSEGYCEEPVLSIKRGSVAKEDRGLITAEITVSATVPCLKWDGRQYSSRYHLYDYHLKTYHGYVTVVVIKPDGYYRIAGDKNSLDSGGLQKELGRIFAAGAEGLLFIQAPPAEMDGKVLEVMKLADKCCEITHFQILPGPP